MDTDKHGWELKDNALPLQSRVFEIQNQPDAQFHYSKIIQHLATFVVRDPVNYLCIHNDRAECDEVRNELADLHLSKKDRKTTLLIESNGILFEKHNQGVLVDLLMEAVPYFIQNLKREANDLFCLNL